MGSQSGLSLGLLIGAVVIPRVRRRVIILGMERQLAARSVVENLSRGVVVDELWARGGLAVCAWGCGELVAQVWALDSALAKRGLWAGMEAGGVGEGHMEVGLEVVVWGNVSRMAEQPSVERGMPVGVAWVDVHVVEGEKELKK